MDRNVVCRRERTAGENRQPDADRECRDLAAIPTVRCDSPVLCDTKRVAFAELFESIVAHALGKQHPENRGGKSWRRAGHDGSPTGSPMPHSLSNVLRDSASFALPAEVI